MISNLIKNMSTIVIVLSIAACGGSDSANESISLESSSTSSEIGSFIDSPVEGLTYKTETYSGVTNSNGSFEYKIGETVKFYVGTYYIGEAKGSTVITPYQLYPNDDNAAISVAQLLQTIDEDNDASNGITLVNQEQFSALDNTVSPADANFENELNNKLGLVLTVSKIEAKEHLDLTIADALLTDTTAPVFESINSVSVNENQITALTLVAVDTQSSILYSVSGVDASNIDVDGTTGKVTFKIAPDYEMKNQYSIVATATDEAGNTASQNLIINILDINEYFPDTTAPVFTSNDVVNVNENQLTALTLTATDEQSAVTYYIYSGDVDSFTLYSTTGLIKFKTAPDFEVKKSYSFKVGAKDSSGNYSDQDIVINILDVDESTSDITAPKFTSTSSVSVNENQTSVLTLVATDTQSSIKYSIFDQDSSSFNVNEITGVVSFKIAADYETKSYYTFTAKATDLAGNEENQNISVIVLDIDELIPDTIAPVFTSNDVVNVNENQLTALTLTATDEQSTVIYSIYSGDVSSFTLNSTTGVITFITAPDFEVKNSYSFTVSAKDSSGNYSSQVIVINILDVDENTPAQVPSATDRTVVHTVNLFELAQAQAKTPLAYLQDQFDAKKTSAFVENDVNVFSQYDASATSTYSLNNWASEFDFSGVAWGSIFSGTLITNQHIVVVNHMYQNIGDKVVFHRKDGSRIERTIIARAPLKDIDSRLWDGLVSKLDAPVPDDVKVYSILDYNGMGDFSNIIDAPYIMTDQKRKIFAEKVYPFERRSWEMVTFGVNNSLPSFMYHSAISGDSAGPGFMIVDGELVLAGALSYVENGRMSSHFLGFQSMQDAITQAIENMKDVQ